MIEKIKSCWPWVLLVVALSVPAVAWGSAMQWSVQGLTVYAMFPLLGLWAWSSMWTHYVYGALRAADQRFAKNTLYEHVSAYIVLACIILHPGLLAWAQWRAGAGLPPGSYCAYAGQAAKLFIWLGIISLTCFLAFEVLRRLSARPLVKKYWLWVSLSQMVAMTLIFIHSLRLGQHLQGGWFRSYWMILGAILAPCFVLVARADWQKAKSAS